MAVPVRATGICGWRMKPRKCSVVIFPFKAAFLSFPDGRRVRLVGVWEVHTGTLNASHRAHENELTVLFDRPGSRGGIDLLHQRAVRRGSASAQEDLPGGNAVLHEPSIQGRRHGKGCGGV